jgi:hypothetical protein
VGKGNPTIEDALLSVDYIDHDFPLPGMAPGQDSVKQTNALLHTAFQFEAKVIAASRPIQGIDTVIYR